jgi:nucleotide-binding universal stress UspA family protein
MSATCLPVQGPELATARPRLKGPILLATDGTAQSAGAFAAAVCIAADPAPRSQRQAKLPVHVLTVCDAVPVAPPAGFAHVPVDFLERRQAGLLANTLAQVRHNVGDTSNWRVDVKAGPAAATIAVIAAESDASLVVMGLGRHEFKDRVFGGETALHLMQMCCVPVLAVPQNWIGIPHRVLIAVDFGPASLRAARTAMRIVAHRGDVCFAHVAQYSALPEFDKPLSESYRTNLNEELDRFIEAVGVPADVTVTRARLYGDTSLALLNWAHTHGADMIVSGTHGVNALARMVVGSVAGKLVRGARCAVLVASAPRQVETTESVSDDLCARPSWHRVGVPASTTTATTTTTAL